LNKRRIFLALLILVFVFIISSYLFLINELPATLSIVKGNVSTVIFDFPFKIYIGAEKNNYLEINGKELSNNYLMLDTGSPIRLKGEEIGQYLLDLKLFAYIPIKTITINVLPDINIYPGGQAIGVLLRSKGVMVVGISDVEAKDGYKYYPARDAGIKIGDVILSINEKVVNDKNELFSLIQEFSINNSIINLKIKSKTGSIRTVEVKTVKNREDIYMIGLYVDDGVAGVGTLSFYDAESREFGALGHVITESNNQTAIEVREGHIIEVQISGINSGKRGLPGEKLGTFFQADDILGNIEKNTDFGIFGVLSRKPVNNYFKKPIPVATISQVEEGPAKIYTVVQRDEIEEFKINIDRVYRQSKPGSKGMIISILDDDLKKMTGGIIQGMSGSPIIQNGCLIGAVTHVFVNNPTKGYGVFAEWMIMETNIFNKTRIEIP
jgi:stage IV sporulation protein B